MLTHIDLIHSLKLQYNKQMGLYQTKKLLHGKGNSSSPTPMPAYTPTYHSYPHNEMLRVDFVKKQNHYAYTHTFIPCPFSPHNLNVVF